ncbi:MAG: Asp-tRNA(Asn)/Glu-tRNA(Gln) amidotransferase subunit GatC [Burkholderiaceae bacterium]|jgi:aspartyl-tRNA(Asn)/glutamyl-tRNA(Gln) amidotransferase subunit C|nr:Asp-tRNA(Asn)/Glu-tRNA(Gln) amidotransferase subunit GatC [Burkholderiaceae bacterium]
MPLTPTDIQRIAQLAQLRLDEPTSARMLTQINGFFDIVEQMRAVDTTGVDPLAHPVAAMQDIQLRLRDDVVSEPNQREANQKSAPAVERGLFLVPKVIE